MLPVLVVLAVAALLRLWAIGQVGFNSDEAVYAGTAASIAGDSELATMFPVFRAHPVLLQMLVSLVYQGGVTDWAARAVCAVIGVGAVAVTYALGRRLYGHVAGLYAALLLAVMPYHVAVSRQVLLDGLMTMLATAVLYFVVRYAETIALRWMLAAGAMMGLTILAKETSAVLLGGLYVFFALTPVVRLRVKHLLLSAAAFVAVVAVMPIVLAGSGRTSSGQNYLLWQLVRRPNHPYLFYFEVVPTAIGVLVIAVAIAGLMWLRKENTWRERLLLSWAAVPIAFFTLWPVKGFQYLLPVAPIVAVLAGRVLARSGEAIALLARRLRARLGDRGRAVPSFDAGRPARWAAVSAVVVVTVASIAAPAWRQLAAPTDGTFLAGTGGLPGGREAGEWIANHAPDGAQLLAIGPSMANVLQFYGRRRVLALSVNPNPAQRNPSYLPVSNPDKAMRGGEFQYVVWDTYTAGRTPFFAGKMRELIEKYHGIAVYTATTAVRTADGVDVKAPVIVIYQVRVS